MASGGGVRWAPPSRTRDIIIPAMTRLRHCLRVVALLAMPSLCAFGQRTTGTLPGMPAPRDTLRKAPRGVIDGLVTDTNLVPLAGAEVTVLRSQVRVRTSENGRFRVLGTPAGAYLLVVRRIGYRPLTDLVEVIPHDTLRLTFALERAPQSLDTVVVTERRQSPRMREFDARRKLGMGEFMTRDDIERRAALGVKDLLRTFRTVNVSPSYTKGPMAEYFALGKRGGGIMQGECAMTVLTDGVQMPKPFDLNLLPPPRDIAGIEVYAGSATVPAQYAALNSGCGVVLVWTRDGFR